MHTSSEEESEQLLFWPKSSLYNFDADSILVIENNFAVEGVVVVGLLFGCSLAALWLLFGCSAN
jgi:hypothetical protein